jgi:hypothetical protein
MDGDLLAAIADRAADLEHGGTTRVRDRCHVLTLDVTPVFSSGLNESFPACHAACCQRN